MEDTINQAWPEAYRQIGEATAGLSFSMSSHVLTCSLLRSLAATKPGGRLLEMGTGTGLATSWILDGMDAAASLTSFDYDPELLAIARSYLGSDARLNLVEADGEDWVMGNLENRYDYIFADTWHGKFLLLEEVLAMLNPAGLYIIDDMLPAADWPEGHAEKVTGLIAFLEQHPDLLLTKLDWATGLIIAVKRS